MEKPVTEARAQFADLVNRVAYTGEPVVLTRRGRVMAALVSAEDLELLQRLKSGSPALTDAGAPPTERQDRPADRRAPAAPLRIAAELRRDRPPPGFNR
ncbi:prevent-host-death family protein [Thermomonospora umbrina]|uniref:Antitoxin n=1 Tax=Thermomonospora umbrina TaxID=111806 RepID=A0A3D9T6N8_9ACTN|nr:type II toxin-antitoxin system Phd/YefM family antitoxin [Thermomonospora umbrina]REF00906.1 prevent-host-death family protein [Thermomonospora umbrina]